MPRNTPSSLPLWGKLLIGFAAALLTGIFALILFTGNPYAPEEILNGLTGSDGAGETNELDPSDPAFGTPRFASAELDPLQAGAVALYAPGGFYWKDGKGDLRVLEDGSYPFSGEGKDPAVCGTCAVYRDALNALRVDLGPREYVCADVRGETVYAFEREEMLYVFSYEEEILYLNRYLPTGEKDKYNNAALVLRRQDGQTGTAKWVKVTGNLPNIFLLTDGEGRLCFGRFTDLTTLEEAPVLNMTEISATEAEVLTVGLHEEGITPLISDENGLSYWKNDKLHPFSLPEGRTEEGLKRAILARRQILIYDDATYLSNAESGVLEKSLLLTSLKNDIRTLCVNENGALLLLMSDGVVYRMRG